MKPEQFRHALCEQTIDAVLSKLAANPRAFDKESSAAAAVGGFLRGARSTVADFGKGYWNALRGRVKVDPRLLRSTAEATEGASQAARPTARVSPINPELGPLAIKDPVAASTGDASMAGAFTKVRGGRHRDISEVAKQMREAAGSATDEAAKARYAETASGLQRAADVGRFKQVAAIGGLGYTSYQFHKGYSSGRRGRGGEIPTYPYHGSQYG